MHTGIVCVATILYQSTIRNPCFMSRLGFFMTDFRWRQIKQTCTFTLDVTFDIKIQVCFIWRHLKSIIKNPKTWHKTGVSYSDPRSYEWLRSILVEGGSWWNWTLMHKLDYIDDFWLGRLQETPHGYGGVFHSIHFFLWKYFEIRKTILKKCEKHV